MGKKKFSRFVRKITKGSRYPGYQTGKRIMRLPPLRHNIRRPLPNNPIPPFHLMKLRMTTMWQVNTNAISNGYILWQMNNLYQPFSLANGTVAVSNANIIHTSGNVDGDGPNCFTNYCSSTGLYSTYRVLSSSAYVRCADSIGGSNQNIRYVLAITPSLTSAYGSYKNAVQSQYAKSSRNTATVYTPNSLRNIISIHKAMGVSKRIVLDDDSYYALYNAGPTTSPSFQLDFYTGDGANLGSATGLNFEINMEWVVRFERPNYVGSTD